MQFNSKQYTDGSSEVSQPTILIVCPTRNLQNLTRAHLSKTEYTLVFARNRETALAALVHRPALALIDVVQLGINVHEQHSNLKFALGRALISQAEYITALDKLNNEICAVERRRTGVEIAQDIRRHVAAIPIIFTSVDAPDLRALPFGQVFHLLESSDKLQAKIEDVLHNRSALVQPVPTTILARPRVRATMY